jgi:hypothetical protein
MKQITISIIILTVFAWMACPTQAAGGDRAGLYAPRSKAQAVEQPAVKQSPGLYEVPQTEGLLRAGGTEGDGTGNSNKEVPVRDNLLFLLLGATAYLVIRKNSKRRVLDL